MWSQEVACHPHIDGSSADDWLSDQLSKKKKLQFCTFIAQNNRTEFVERAREYLKTATEFRLTSNVVGQQRVMDGTALDTSKKTLVDLLILKTHTTHDSLL